MSDMPPQAAALRDRFRASWRSQPSGLVPRLRWWGWRWLRWYRYEQCRSCGRPVAHSTGETWWEADDALWIAAEGSKAGIRCIPCFTRDCADAGLGLVYWRAAIRGDDS